MNRKGTTVTEEHFYFGRRAEVTITHHDSNLVGLRTVRCRWIDDADERRGGYPAGTVTEKVIKGDGRKPNFVVITEEHVVEES